MLLAASTSTIDTTNTQVSPGRAPMSSGAPAGIRLADLDQQNPADATRQYAIELTRGAIARYESAVRQRQLGNEAGGDSRRWDHWIDLTVLHLKAAEEALLATIMGWNPAISSNALPAALRFWHPAQGVQIDGRQFLAVPMSGTYPGDASDQSIMTLVILDKVAIHDLGEF